MKAKVKSLIEGIKNKVLDAIIKRVNITAQDVACAVDLSDIASELDYAEIAGLVEIDSAEIADNINMDEGTIVEAVANKFDASDIAGEVDLYDVSSNIDLTDLVDYLDKDDIISAASDNIDLESLAEAAGVTEALQEVQCKASPSTDEILLALADLIRDKVQA